MKKHLNLIFLVLMITLSLCIFVGCSNLQKVLKLDVPTNVVYDGNVITWNMVEDAASYEVNVNGQIYTSAGNSLVHVMSTNKASISVRAISGTEHKNNSDWSAVAVYNKLDTPSDLTIINGVLTWSEVENATGYQIYEGQTSLGVTTTNTFSDFALGNVSHTLTVKALGDKYSFSSKQSAPITFSVLDSPKNLQYDRDNHMVVWEPVDGCKGYTVKVSIDGAKSSEYTIGEGITSLSLTKFMNGKFAEVQVQANIISGNMYSSQYSLKICIKQLDTVDVTSINIKEEAENAAKVTFANVDNAEKYLIKVNNIELPIIKEPYFDCDFANDTNSVQFIAVAPITPIKANGVTTYYIDSDPAKKEIVRLAIPSNIRLDKGILVWDKGGTEISWDVSVNDVVTTVTEQKYTFSLEDAGIQKTMVRAKGDGCATLSSRYSEVFSVVKLSQPKNFALNNGILSWEMVSGSTSYTVYINDNKVNVTVNNISINSYNDVKVLEVQVVANGDDSKKIISSKMSNRFSITKLDTPTNIIVDNKGVIHWNAVDNAFNYCININKKKIYEAGTDYDLSMLIADGEGFVFSISAQPQKGSLQYSSSSESALYSGKKLVAPSNIRIEGNNIVWDSVKGVTSYELSLNGKTTIIKNNNKYFPNLNENNQQNVVTIKSIANADSNVTNDLFIDSSQSQQFKFASEKLTTPTNVVLKVVNTDEGSKLNISCNPVANASKYKISIGGVDYYSDTNEYIYNIQNAGKFNVVVTAIGDHCNFVDSLQSTAKNISILAPTTLSIELMDKDYYLLSWAGIQGGVGYRLITTVYDKATNEVVKELSGSKDLGFDKVAMELNTDTAKYKYSYRMQVVGDGINYIDSALSNEVVIYEIGE